MRLVDVDHSTEGTFLRCLHDEAPDDPRVIKLRRQWIDAHKDKGWRAKVLVLDSGEVAALCQYMPIEHSHFVGENLLVILCIWVHGYDHHIGNRQGRGYGRLILQNIEEEARVSGASGVVAWGMDFPHWNPVSFYEHMGYSRVEKSGMAVLVWKPFNGTVTPPRFQRQVRTPIADTDNISVMMFANGWCTGNCSQLITVREAVEGLEGIVDYREIDTSEQQIQQEWGIADGLFVDGQPYRPYEPPCTSEVLRKDLVNMVARDRREGGAAEIETG